VDILDAERITVLEHLTLVKRMQILMELETFVTKMPMEMELLMGL
jgi:hypothetical protein